jgi:hypothetical protein
MSATPRLSDSIDRHEAVADDVKHNPYLPPTPDDKRVSVSANDSLGIGNMKEGKDLESRGKEERVSTFKLYYRRFHAKHIVRAVMFGLFTG